MPPGRALPSEAETAGFSLRFRRTRARVRCGRWALRSRAAGGAGCRLQNPGPAGPNRFRGDRARGGEPGDPVAGRRVSMTAGQASRRQAPASPLAPDRGLTPRAARRQAARLPVAREFLPRYFHRRIVIERERGLSGFSIGYGPVVPRAEGIRDARNLGAPIRGDCKIAFGPRANGRSRDRNIRRLLGQARVAETARSRCGVIDGAALLTG